MGGGVSVKLLSYCDEKYKYKHKIQIQLLRTPRGGAGVKLLSYCDGEAPGGRSLCVLNCRKVMEGHPGTHPHNYHDN